MEKEKIVFKGSHPDSLYRVSSSSGAGAGKMARVLRVLRWPAVLLVACVALIMFVYFLMPSNLDSDLEVVNGTYWENKAVARFGGHKHNKNSENNKKNTKTTADVGKKGSKTPEIDFYEADPNKDKKYDFISVVEKITENDQNAKTPIAPVFPEHISPEVQYGNEEADTQKLRHPKLMTENNVPSDSTAKPHITQKPEKPLAIYFDDASNTETASTESVSRAETINDFTNDEKESTKTTKLYYPPGQKHRPTQLKPFGKIEYNSAEIPPEVQEYYGRREPSAHVPITSSHSKYFGIGIEDAESLKSTTQNSIYNTRVSPTLPTWRDGDDTTTKKYPVNNPDAPQCHSTQLPLCRGVLPYDLAGNPAKIAGVEATQHLAQIEFLVSTNCSERIKQFFCGLLEPECNASPYPPNLPCFNLCQTIKDTCDAFIPRELLPTFNCRQYSNTNCLGARAPCSDRELQCGDGTCVLRDWICDGTRDCLGGEDEKECVSCRSNEFICPTGGCISKVWTCDGYEDCPGGEDEAEQLCNGRHQPTRYEPGEESAGSAPAPAYKKIDDHDSSKELLMTSDSSNALKRNFTRRPSPSRLSPYKPKLRLNQATTPLPAKQEENDDNAEQVTWGPSSEEETETKDVAKSKAPPKPTHPQPKTENSNNRESDEDLRMSDMGIFDESEKTNADEVQKLITTATPKSNNKHLPVPPLPRMPPFMVPTPNKPSKMSSSLVPSPVYTPGSMREYNLPSAATKPPSTILDKSVNQYEKIIDGATLLRKAAEAAAAEARASSVNATDKFDDDYPVARQRTSHISPCPSGELRCVDGRCITLAQLCDGTIDCSDHADEDNCFT